MNSRKEWIDGLRALAMLIVMTWHKLAMESIHNGCSV